MFHFHVGTAICQNLLWKIVLLVSCNVFCFMQKSEKQKWADPKALLFHKANCFWVVVLIQ